MTSWFNPANRSLDHGGVAAAALKRRFPKSCDRRPPAPLPDGTIVQQKIRDHGSYGEVIHCCYSGKNSPDRLASAFYDEDDEKYLYRILQEGALAAKNPCRVITLFGDGIFKYSHQDSVRALAKMLQKHKSCEWWICCTEMVMGEIERALVQPEHLYPDPFLRPDRNVHTPRADVVVQIPIKIGGFGIPGYIEEGPGDTSLEAQGRQQAGQSNPTTPGNASGSSMGSFAPENRGCAVPTDLDRGIRQNIVVRILKETAPMDSGTFVHTSECLKTYMRKPPLPDYEQEIVDQTGVVYIYIQEIRSLPPCKYGNYQKIESLSSDESNGYRAVYRASDRETFIRAIHPLVNSAEAGEMVTINLRGRDWEDPPEVLLTWIKDILPLFGGAIFYILLPADREGDALVTRDDEDEDDEGSESEGDEEGQREDGNQVGGGRESEER